MSNELFRKLRRQANAESRSMYKVVEEHIDATYFKATHPDFDCFTQEKARKLLHKLVPIMAVVSQDRLDGMTLEDQVALLNDSELKTREQPEIGVIPGKSRL